MKHRLFPVSFIAGLSVFVPASLCMTGCKQLETKLAESVITNVTDAVCTPLEQQTSNIYVDFICAIVEGGESVITDLTTGKKMTATLARTQMTVRVPAADAAAFAAQHSEMAVTARKAARGR